MDLSLDSSTGDLYIDGGLKTITDVDEILQRIRVGLTINLNEFFTHANYGLPWVKSNSDTSDTQYFLGNSDTTIDYIVSSIDDYISDFGGVESVTSSYEFDYSTRTLTYTPYIVSTDGEDFTYPAYVLEL